MILNVSFEKTISIELEADDNIDINDISALVDAVVNSGEIDYIDEWLDDQPAIGYRIECEDGTNYGEPYGSLIFDRNGLV